MDVYKRHGYNNSDEYLEALADELKDCPNCGGRPKVHRKNKKKFYIECDGDCWTQTHKHWDIADAVKEWNSIRKRVHNEDLEES